jgi:alkanesulfonate monooxygenase SsuD/methylene tetrahydromethanopterin reductase-like flavin-dependent oxidoreductase (luciferase family)
MWAAELGLPYAFADFINPNGADIARRYREAFTPSRFRDAPEVIVAAWAVCAETDAEAHRLGSSADMAFARAPAPSIISR